MRNLAIYVALVSCWISPLSAYDPVRQNELHTRILVAGATENTRNLEFQQEVQHRQFTAKFNQLVEAVASFAKEYNKGNGSVWPRREADKLHKALRELESAEKSLR